MRLALLLALSVACGPEEGTDLDGDGVVDADDCAASDPDVFPGADERCNGVDDDCDGAVDEDPVDGTTFQADVDGDGFGDPDVAVVACAIATGLAANADDCDDGDDTISPDGVEVCDGVDQDCDETADNDATDATAWYVDGDEDGLGAGDATFACDAPTGSVANADDCDDLVDTVLAATTLYEDVDGDGFGDPATALIACPAAELVADATDCDDDDDAVHPGAAERCDLVDTDCDPSTSEAGIATWFGDDGDVSDWTAAMGSSTATVVTASGVLRVCAGTWTGRLDVGEGADVALIGAGRGATVLTAGGLGRVVQVRSESTASLSAVTIDDAADAGGSALRCDGGRLSLHDVEAVDNIVDRTGSVVEAVGCTVDIADSRFEHNGDPVFLSTGAVVAVSASGELTLARTDFVDSVGFDLYVSSVPATLTDVAVTGPTGGLYARSTTIEMVGTAFGGIYLLQNGALIARDTTFGGTVHGVSSTATFEDVVVSGDVSWLGTAAALTWTRTGTAPNGLDGQIGVGSFGSPLLLEDVDLDGDVDVVQSDGGAIRGYGAHTWLSCPTGNCHERTETTPTTSAAQNDYLVGIIVDIDDQPTRTLWRAVPYLWTVDECDELHTYLLTASGTNGPWKVVAAVTEELSTGELAYEADTDPFPSPAIPDPTKVYALAFHTTGCPMPRYADEGTSVTIPGIGTTWGFLYKEAPPVYTVGQTISGTSAILGTFLRVAIDTMPVIP